MNKRRALLLLTGITLALSGCANYPDAIAGGGGSEVEVIGKLYISTGVPATNAQVKIVPENHNPVRDGTVPDRLIDTTDENGVYRMRRVQPGVYNIQAVDIPTRKRALITGITVQGEITVVPEDILSNPGMIRVVLTESVDTVNGYFYIPGTDISKNLYDVRDTVIMDSLPQEILPALCYGKTNDSVATIMRERIQIIPEDTITIFNPGWRFSQVLYLNTTDAGSNIPENCTDFPILVRLTGENFDFAEVQRTGADIRFTKSDNTPLSYEIERWDSVNQLGEIWIRVDTVYGNTDMHYMMMYWGASAGTASRGDAVFDTTDGYLGVWHLSEPANTAPDGYRDATVHGYHLTGTGTTPTVAGIIGNARNFDIKTDYLSGTISSALNGNSSFTVSFWVNITYINPGNTQSSRIDILDFGQKNVNKAAFHFLIWPSYLAQFGFEDQSIVDTAPTITTPLSQNVFYFTGNGIWTSIVTTYSASDSILTTYINGIQVDSDTASGVNIVSSGGMRVGMPYYDTESEFIGQVDEIRILSGVMQLNRIRLQYENQKPDSRLVEAEFYKRE